MRSDTQPVSGSTSPSGAERGSSAAVFAGNDFRDAPFHVEQGVAIEPDDEASGGHEGQRVVRLGIRPLRIVELEMEQGGKQEAAV